VWSAWCPGFSLHDHLPAAVPILSTSLPPQAHARLLQERLHNTSPRRRGPTAGPSLGRTVRHTDLYDGLLLFNPRTMFAVRLCYPTMVFLTPLLKHHQPMDEFLAVRTVQACLADHSQPSVDHATLHWYRSLMQAGRGPGPARGRPR
jgi:hypothetical protein